MLDSIIAGMSLDQLLHTKHIYMGVISLIVACIVFSTAFVMENSDSMKVILSFSVAGIIAMIALFFICTPIETKIENAIDDARESETDYVYEIQIEINEDDFGIDES